MTSENSPQGQTYPLSEVKCERDDDDYGNGDGGGSSGGDDG